MNLLFSSIFLIFVIATSVEAQVTTYYDLDFSDGTFGGGYVPDFDCGSCIPFSEPEIVYSSQLDSNSLQFSRRDQMVWELNGETSNYQYISFDFYTIYEDSIVVFLDCPSIKRTDIGITGKHRVEIYYDLLQKTSVTLLDGDIYSDFEVINDWTPPPRVISVRISHNKGYWMPGGPFQIDNFIWKGGVKYRENQISLTPIIPLLL